MKKILFVGLAAAALMSAGCSKSGSEDKAPAIVCGQYTEVSNMVPCLGCAAEDVESLYFPVLDGDKLTLVKQNKSTGNRTVLDSIDKPADGSDYSFQFIQTSGKYVYYMPFDVNDSGNRTYKIWRVSKDGEEKTMISAQGDILQEFYILNGKIYYRYLFDHQGVWTSRLDGGGAQQLLDKNMNYPILYDGRYYYSSYGEYPAIKLVSCLEDGTDEKVLQEKTGNLTFAIADNGKINAACPGENGWDLISMNADGTGLKTLAEGLPVVSFINSLGNDVFFSCYSGNDSYSAGLYCLSGSTLNRLVEAKVMNFSMLDGGRIIYMNADDTSCGRLGAAYMTDINGKYDKKL